MNFVDVAESAYMAVDTVRTNKLRSSLTILGVMVGVVTVMFMVSIIQGLNKSFAAQIESLGSNTIWATKFDPSIGHQPTDEEVHRAELTLEDADAIRSEAPSVADTSPFYRKIAETVRYRENQTDTPILLGVTPHYEFVMSSYIGYGRFISDLDVEQRANVCILGRDVVKALFNYQDPLDKEVKIAGRPFKVIGVMEPLGQILGQSRDNQVYVPVTTFQKYYPQFDFPETIFGIFVRPQNRAYVQKAIDEITDILRRRRQIKQGEPNNFGISSQDALLDVYNQLTGATYLVLTAVSAVALMIGGIGVMNIMLVSVTERTKEIGLRKAVGATRLNILTQFLIEAVMLTAIGGFLGLALGEMASLLMNKYSPLPAYVPAWAIAVGIGISASVGIIFGLWPAWKAARLDPIESLRYE